MPFYSDRRWCVEETIDAVIPSKAEPKKLTRLFFASDFHGSQRIFRKFLNAAKHYEADVLIMGGDVVGKLAIPVIREGNGSYRAHLMGKTEHLEGQSDLQGFEDRLGTLGYYSKIMDQDEYQAIKSDAAAVDRLFHDLARERLASWIELAETRLAESGVKCFVIGGNDDDPEVLELLKDADTQSFIFCEGKEVEIDADHTMISVGFSNRTPWKTPREIDDDDLGKMIEGLAGSVADADHAIFNFHVPPADSTLDTCPMLDWSTSSADSNRQRGPGRTARCRQQGRASGDRNAPAAAQPAWPYS